MTGRHLGLRPATLSDASSIAALSIEVWIGTYLKSGIDGFFADFVLSEFTAPKMESRLADPRNHVIVSENTQGIDGFACLTRASPAPVPGCSDWEISTLYVQPRHHGKGIGRDLLQALLQTCRAQGAPSVWLATNAENTPAIGFYRAHGFEPVGETHFRIGDQGYLNTVFRLGLG